MTESRNKRTGRGLARASAETRREVARMGGKAYHEKRGAKGSDRTSQRPEE